MDRGFTIALLVCGRALLLVSAVAMAILGYWTYQLEASYKGIPTVTIERILGISFLSGSFAGGVAMVGVANYRSKKLGAKKEERL